MYVGITRAKDELYLSFAQRRRIWGDIKYFPKSRFIDEIPPELLEDDGTRRAYRGDNDNYGRSTFKSAADKIRENKDFNSSKKSFTKNYGSAAGFNSQSGSNAQGGGFSNNLASSLKNLKKTTSQKVERSGNKAFVVKHNSANEKEIKEQKSEKNISDIIAKCKAMAKSPNGGQKASFNTFKAGTRVFHPHFGIGHILEVQGEGLSATYKVDFSKNGVKTVDGSIGGLKAF